MGDFVKQVGLFGGTFNPLHFGHINLALEIQEKRELDEVWFIPAHCSPLKTGEPHLADQHRLKILEIGLEPIPCFQICPVEIERRPPSYTIDTVKLLKQSYPDLSFSLVVGEDSLIRFREWKEYQELARLLPLLIGSRHKSELMTHLPELGLGVEVNEVIRQGIIPTRQLEISASEIRDRLKKRFYCGHLIPEKVLDYIMVHQLYFNTLT